MKYTKTFLLLVIITILSACKTNTRRTVYYQGIYADDSTGLEGLYNPERGFRLEVAVDIADKNYVWEPEKYPDITSYLEEQSEMYASDSVSLVQTYFYLTGMVGKELTDENFQVMDTFFNKLRKLGKKSVLRFAYETDFMGRVKTGPTLEDIICHTEQLKPFLEKNKDIIQVVQAGMIGAWGEWHSSFHGLEQSEETKRIILENILCMTPENRMLQVRVPSYKNLLKKNEKAYSRISFHDDFIIVDPHKWDGGMHEGTEFFNQIVRESPYLPVDGELPWGNWSVNKGPDNPEPGWIIDGMKTARQLFLQHYTSLSAIHNYKERGAPDKYSMMYWKETPVDTTFLKENKMPVSDAYFKKKDGSPAERNVFDYIRDHLGYRIELQEMTAPSILSFTDLNSVEISLINRGFSTLFNEHPVYLVLIDEAENVCYTSLTNADVNTWQPYQPGDSLRSPLVHKVKSDLKIPADLSKGTYRLGLWIPDGSERLKYDNRFAIRCANGNVGWWISKDKKYGINILSEIVL